MNYAYAIQIATDLIKDEEDLYKVLPDGRVQAYWDDAGKIWTIGWGNTYYQNGASVKQGDIITKKQAEELLKFVVAQKEKVLRPMVTAKLNENQYAALISLTYNCGEGNVKKSDLLKMINAGAPEDDIEAQFVKTCVTAKGKYMAGLYRRRTNELSLYMHEVMRVIQSNPEISLLTAFTILGVTGYYIYRFAKLKRAA